MTSARRALYALDPWLLPPVVWGGFELQRRFGKAAPADARLGESWEVSCVSGKESTLQGSTMTLASVFEGQAEHFLGARPSDPSFPLLVKLLATSAPLSVQVHPSDEQARRLEGSPHGKHEAWVVLATGPAAEVCAGLRPGAAASDLFEAARSGDGTRVRGLLTSHPVTPGDVVLVPPGCVHAPGADLVLYEVQQPVDLTYRIFDWGRVGLDGKPRQLHVEKARSVVDAAARPTIKRSPRSGTPVPATALCRTRLVETRPFVVERWSVTACTAAPAADLLLVTCIGGHGALSAGPDRVLLARGQSCVVPASTSEDMIEGEDLDLLVARRS